MKDTGVVPHSALPVHGEMLPRCDEIRTPNALDFAAELAVEFGARRVELLQARIGCHLLHDQELGLGGARDVFASICLTEDWPQFFTDNADDLYLVNADT